MTQTATPTSAPVRSWLVSSSNKGNRWSRCRSILTCDPDLVRDFWLYEYAPLVLDTEARRYPAVADITETLGGRTAVITVPIPVDCFDGFNEAYSGRPGR